MHIYSTTFIKSATNPSGYPETDYPEVAFAGKRIGYPKIGAGLAGGDWSIIEEIIDRELEGEDHTLVYLN
jgi:O-acetyl-ADP-ribose deacetylase (regulator of RNase III)